MSIQSDIESKLIVAVETAIVTMTATAGPKTVPQVEGTERYCSIREVSSRGTRLDWGQTQWADAYALTMYWHVTIPRATCATEWEAFAAAMSGGDLLATVSGVFQSWISETSWAEPHDAGMRTMTTVIETERIE